MEQDNGTTGKPENEPDKGRRSFIAGAASLLAGAAVSPAFAAPAPVKPLRNLSKAEATALLNSVNKDTLAVMVMLESGGDPKAQNINRKTGQRVSNVYGAGQFLPSTAHSVGFNPHFDYKKRPGLLFTEHDERGDAYLSLLGMARLQKSNNDYLKSATGRDPKPYETYLAHQQGVAGAAALMNGGSKNAIDALTPAYRGNRGIARQAIVNNGGKENTTAAEFVQIVAAFYNKSASNPYSASAGKKWVAHVAEHQGLSKEFLASDPYFSKRKIRDSKRTPTKPDDPDKDLRTYNEMLEYLLIDPNSKWAKDFPLPTKVINRAWGGTGEKREPTKQEEFPAAEKFWERLINGQKGNNKSPSR